MTARVGQPACLTTRRPEHAKKAVIRDPKPHASDAAAAQGRLALRLFAVLDVQLKYACARLFPPPGSRLVLTALSSTSPRHVVRKADLIRRMFQARNQLKVLDRHRASVSADCDTVSL